MCTYRTHSAHLNPGAFTLLCPSLSCVTGPGVCRCWYSCELPCVCCETVAPRLPLKETELPNELLLWAANVHPSPSICSSKQPLSSTHTSETQLPLFYPSLIHFNTNSNSIHSSWTCVSDSGTVWDFHAILHLAFFPIHKTCIFLNLFFYLFIYIAIYFILYYYTGLEFRILPIKLLFYGIFDQTNAALMSKRDFF